MRLYLYAICFCEVISEVNIVFLITNVDMKLGCQQFTFTWLLDDILSTTHDDCGLQTAVAWEISTGIILSNFPSKLKKTNSNLCCIWASSCLYNLASRLKPYRLL